MAILEVLFLWPILGTPRNIHETGSDKMWRNLNLNTFFTCVYFPRFQKLNPNNEHSEFETTQLDVGEYTKHEDPNLGNTRHLVFEVYSVVRVIVRRPGLNIRHPIITTP